MVNKRVSYKRSITNVFKNVTENIASFSWCKHIVEKNIAFIEELDQSINYLYLVEQEEDFDEENIPDVHGIELNKQSEYHLSVVNQLSEFLQVSENSSKETVIAASNFKVKLPDLNKVRHF